MRLPSQQGLDLCSCRGAHLVVILPHAGASAHKDACQAVEGPHPQKQTLGRPNQSTHDALLVAKLRSAAQRCMHHNIKYVFLDCARERTM